MGNRGQGFSPRLVETGGWKPVCIFRARTLAVLMTAILSVLTGVSQEIVSIPIRIGAATALHRSPYLIEYRISLRDFFGNAVAAGTESMRLVPREDGRPVSRDESGAVILPASNRSMDSVLLMDYSRSMSSLQSGADDNLNGVSDTLEAMEVLASDLFALMTRDTRMAVMEIHNSLAEAGLVSGLSGDAASLDLEVAGLRGSLQGQFAGSTRLWDGAMDAIGLLEAEANRAQRAVFLLSDGTDESSLTDPVELAHRAVEAGVSIHAVLFNRPEPVSESAGPLSFSVRVGSDHLSPVLVAADGVAFKSGEARLVVPREYRSPVPEGDGWSFLGPVGRPVYIVSGSASGNIPAPAFPPPDFDDELNRNDIDSVSIALVDFSGPGEFSIFFERGEDPPLVALTTVDGLNPDLDSFNLPDAGSSPLMPSLGFSRSGDYTMTFEIRAMDGAGNPVARTRYQLEAVVLEDRRLVETGVVRADFSFDAGAWGQSLRYQGQELEAMNTIVVLGPENQLLVTNPDEFPFHDGRSIFFMPVSGEPVGIQFGFSGIPEEVLVDDAFSIQLVDVTGPGEVFVGTDPNALYFNSSDGLDGSDVIRGVPGETLQPFWAFTEPGDYTLSFEARGTTIDPEEEAVSAILEINIRVESDSNVLVTLQTRGSYFNAHRRDRMTDLYARMIYNLQGEYFIRWSTLKRGDSPFTPSFDLFLNGQSASMRGDPVIPSTLAGNILEAVMQWNNKVLPDGSGELVLQMNYVPRDFPGVILKYASRLPLALERIPSEEGGLIPDDWEINHDREGDVGSVRIAGPRGAFGLETLPFTTAGRILKFRYPSGSFDPSRIFYEFSLETVNPLNSVNLLNRDDFLTPAEQLIHGTSPEWMAAMGFEGTIQDLVIAERSDLDGDGVPLWLEYRHGTNPADPVSFFRLFPPEVSDATGISIRFNTGNFRLYHIEYSQDLQDWFPLREALPGEGRKVVIEDSSADGMDTRFYRVRPTVPVGQTIEAVPMISGTGGHPWLAIHHEAGTTVAAGVDGRIAVHLPGIGWQYPDSPTSENLRAVTFFKGAWIIAGNAGVILRSTDGVDWRPVTAPRVPFLWTLAHNGSRIVAAGYRGGILSSEDGISWVETRTGTSEFLRAMLWDGQTFYAVGGIGVALRSRDGVQWQALSLPSDANFSGITKSGNRFVLVGNEGVILTGSSMENLEPVATTIPPDENFEAVVWASGRFLAASSAGRLWYSEFGSRWDPIQVTGMGESALRQFHFSPSGLVAAGEDGSVWRLEFRLF